jgi:hypothetical protein
VRMRRPRTRPPAVSEWIGRRAVEHIGRLMDEAALHRQAGQAGELSSVSKYSDTFSQL